jgi:hypothetical protein
MSKLEYKHTQKKGGKARTDKKSKRENYVKRDN